MNRSLVHFFVLACLVHSAVSSTNITRVCHQCSGLSDCVSPRTVECPNNEFGCMSANSSLGLVKRGCLYDESGRTPFFLNGCMHNASGDHHLVCGCMNADLCNLHLENKNPAEVANLPSWLWIQQREASRWNSEEQRTALCETNGASGYSITALIIAFGFPSFRCLDFILIRQE
ncbi:hypothetical protein M3Y99_01182700 [Aphelenchoides fujianensis]|nr:hypothetical protein M3Y99_01182700 [Aphelenchoides fujianensis]